MAYEKHLPRAKSAESVGISSLTVQKMVGDMVSRGIGVHSLMILRGGVVACEAWQVPLNAEIPHMVYSVSKSFLATAYGFALDEGKITKDTKFLDVFPEYRPKKRDANFEKLTINHLLTMTSGKKTALKADRNGDWLEKFVKLGWDFAPGENWRYVSENFYAASAMLVRVLGESVTDYLTPRLFEPLGIEKPFWEKSPDGVEAGGWGLMLKTEDLAKFILCYHNGGNFDGKQVVPSWFAREATSRITDNSSVERNLDCKAGYGCGFWRCGGMENTYRCEGMFCQYAISFEDYDACLVITSDHSDLQETLDIIWQYMPSAFIEKSESDDGVKLSIPPDEASVKSGRSPETEKRISGKTYKIHRNRFLNKIGFPVSMLPMPILFFARNSGGNIDNLRLDFSENGVDLSWTEDVNQNNSIFFSLNAEPTDNIIKLGDFVLNCRCLAEWQSESALVIRVRAYVGVAERIFKIEFDGDTVKLYPNSKPSTEEKAEKTGEKLKSILHGRYFHWWIDVLVPRVSGILNPVHKGKMIK